MTAYNIKCTYKDHTKEFVMLSPGDLNEARKSCADRFRDAVEIVVRPVK